MLYFRAIAGESLDRMKGLERKAIAGGSFWSMKGRSLSGEGKASKKKRAKWLAAQDALVQLQESLEG